MKSSITLLKVAIDTFRKDYRRYLSITLVPAGITAVLTFFEPSMDTIPDTETLIFFSIFTLVSLIVTAFMTVGLVFATADASLSAKNALVKAKGRLLAFIWFSFLISCAIVLAYILLIIPGIWLTISLSFGMYYFLLQDKTFKESINESLHLVKGRWWNVAAKTLVLSLAWIIFIIIVETIASPISTFIGEAFSYALTSAIYTLVSPISVIFMYDLFIDLQQNPLISKSEPEDQVNTQTLQ